MDFDADKLKENLEALLVALKKAKPTQAKGVYIKKVSISTTMGAGVAVDQAGPVSYTHLRLPKEWQPVLTYGDLTRLDPTTVTPQQVFNAVCHMRTTKLPDPKVNGNAGSFFKNPVVSAETAEALLSQFPTAPNYPQADGSVKLAAGWLIDQCQLKGMQMGGAAVHRQQALVLIKMCIRDSS